jgi:hypothetical protein
MRAIRSCRPRIRHGITIAALTFTVNRLTELTKALTGWVNAAIPLAHALHALLTALR